MAMKAFKYRIYPNKQAVEALTWNLEQCCEVYNAALQERRERYTLAIKRHPNYYDPAWRKEATKAHAVSLYDQQNQLSKLKEESCPELRDLSAAHLLNDVCARVDRAFKGFFERIKHGKTPGYPRFRSSKRYDSFTYPDRSGWKLEGKYLRLTRIGEIKVKLHRPVEGTIKTCTVKREGEHWYVIFVCEVEITPLPAAPEEAVGIDMGGVSSFATLSTGEHIEHPRYYAKTHTKLAAAQQVLSRKKQGTKRRHKAVQRVAKLHRKVANQRKDFLHKQSRKLIDHYQHIVLKEMEIAPLVKRPEPVRSGQGYARNGAKQQAELHRVVYDAGWAMFTQYTAYKAEWAGRDVLRIDCQNTPLACPSCGVPLVDGTERTYTCSRGCELDRDVLRAQAIRMVGLALVEERKNTQDSSTDEAGSVSASAASASLRERRARRAANPSALSPPSQRDRRDSP